jgi:DNA mismatch repair ATPase MutL
MMAHIHSGNNRNPEEKHGESDNRHKHHHEQLNDSDDETPKKKHIDIINILEVHELLQSELHNLLKTWEKNENCDENYNENHDDKQDENNDENNDEKYDENHDVKDDVKDDDEHNEKDDENRDRTLSPLHSKKDPIIHRKSLLKPDSLVSKLMEKVSAKIDPVQEAVDSSKR